MKFCTTKNPVFCPMGLRRAMPTALAIVATLALVSSAQAEVTYTWNGASGTDDNWFLLNDIDPVTFDSENFSPTLVYSDIDNTNLVFEGTTRPNTILNSSYFGGGQNFSARKLTFNTSANFSITPDDGQELLIGSGGIDNQVAFQQTINSTVRLANTSGTTPVNVAGGGEIVINGGVNYNQTQVVEKTGLGTLTLNSFTQGNQRVLRSQAGTINLTAPNQQYQTNVEVNGGQVNLGPTSRLTGNGVSRVSGGVFSALGGVNNFAGVSITSFEMTSGTMIVGDNTNFDRSSKISGGTVVYSGTGGGVSFSNQEPIRTLTIEGGSQDFGAGTFHNVGEFPGSSVLVTGGTSTGFYDTQGLTNNGGSITFTAKTSAISGQAKNTAADLTFTSGTVSIGTVAGGATAIGALVNGSNLLPRNTTLGAGNTLKLDLDQAGLTKDLLITTGTMNWGGTLAFNLTNSGTLSDSASWNSFFFSNSLKTGAFTGDLIAITLSASSIYNGLNFSRVGVTDIWTSTAASTGQQFRFNESSGLLDIVPVPEPSSIAVVGLGLAMLGWRRLALRQRAAA